MTGKEKRVFHREWTRREINLLNRLYPHHSIKVVAEKLHRTPGEVGQKAFRLGIKRDWKRGYCLLRKGEGQRPYKQWTQREIKVLKRLYPAEHTGVVAEKLHRTEKEIRYVAMYLGLRKDWMGGYHLPKRRLAEKPYTQEEMKQLREIFAVLTVREIARRLGRKYTSVGAKIRELGLGRKPKPIWWMRERIEQLKELYAEHSSAEVAAKMGRTARAIRMRIYLLGLGHKVARYKRRPWTKVEDAILRERYPTCKTDELAKQLGRSPSAVKKRAFNLRILRQTGWAAEEVQELRRAAPTSTIKELAARLGRTNRSVYRKILKLGLGHGGRLLKRWTEAEDAVLRERYPTCKTDELAMHFGRAPHSIRGRAAKLRIHRESHWSPEEILELKRAAPTCTNEELAARLGRTVDSVSGKKHCLGLRKDRFLWTDKEIAILRKFYPMESDAKVARMLGRGRPTINIKAGLLGLRKSPYARMGRKMGKHRKGAYGGG